MAHKFAILALLFTLGGAASAQDNIRFMNFGLSSTPSISCPGSPLCYNHAAEPAIRSDADGNFFASSENGLGKGTVAWRSTDGGLHYTTLVSPNSLSEATDPTFQPGGGDTDLAIAPALNNTGYSNVYIASLTLADVDVSTSSNFGGTWSLNPLSATIPGDDREWVAADRDQKICVSYRTVAGTQLVVNCSYDAGTTFSQVANVFDPDHYAFAAYNARIGNMAIDPQSHNIYQIFAAVADNNEALICTDCNLHTVWMGVSTDGGQTFTDHAIYNNPDQHMSYAHQFPNVSVDQAGNVYAVYCDDHNLYYSFSTDAGQSWSDPQQVNAAPSNTAIFPWSVAAGAGMIDIVWYGTDYYDGTSPPDNYPSSANWYVYFAQNFKATTEGGTFAQVQASPVIHSGAVCEGGVGCTGNRDLYDDFGVSASPISGMASIIYSDDQYRNDPLNPPWPGCTTAQNNTPACDHTAIATQTSGSGIVQP